MPHLIISTLDLAKSTNSQKTLITKRDLTFLISLIIIAGLFTSQFFRALPSLGLVLLLSLTLIDFNKNWSLEYKKYGGVIGIPYLILKEVVFVQLPKNIVFFGKQKTFLILSGVFFIHLLSYFQTSIENIEDYWNQIGLKSALFIIPFCYALLPKLTTKQFHLCLYLYIILLASTCTYSITTYLGNMELYNEAMSRSKPFPVPANHVRFSLMVAFGAYTAYYLFRKKVKVISGIDKYIQIGLSLFFIGFLHLASVRSGMVVLYAIIFSLVVYHTFKSKKIIYGIVAIGSLIIISVSSYFIFPTVRNKVDVTLEDISRTDNMASANYYPMSARLYSYRVGYHLWNENKLFGVGIGNLKREVSKEYISRYIVIYNHIMPHNQYLRYLTAFGLIGFVIFMYCFYYPFFKNRNWLKEPIIAIHYLVISLSFMFEGTLETQLGLNFSLLFIALALSNLKPED